MECTAILITWRDDFYHLGMFSVDKLYNVISSSNSGKTILVEDDLGSQYFFDLVNPFSYGYEWIQYAEQEKQPVLELVVGETYLCNGIVMKILFASDTYVVVADLKGMEGMFTTEEFRESAVKHTLKQWYLNGSLLDPQPRQEQLGTLSYEQQNHLEFK